MAARRASWTEGRGIGARARIKHWPSQAAHARQPCPEGRAPCAGEPLGAALARLGEALARVHAFYDAIGGLPGYQRRCLQMIADGRGAAAGGDGAEGAHGRVRVRAEGTDDDAALRFHRPRGLDLAGADGRALAAAAAAAGLEALPHMAEIYPLGGAPVGRPVWVRGGKAGTVCLYSTHAGPSALCRCAGPSGALALSSARARNTALRPGARGARAGAGDRLGLRCDVTGDSVPTALLPYCGRTLLEGLLRDLQARARPARPPASP